MKCYNKNKELLARTYQYDEYFMSDLAMFVKNLCGYDIVENEVLERRKNQMHIVKEHLNYFLENYANAISRKVSDLTEDDNSNMHFYLMRTYPYCLFKNGQIETKDMESALYFYAINNLSAEDAQLENLIPVLKCINMHHLNNTDLTKYDSNTVFTCYSEINGTTNSKYQAETLYDTIPLLNDIDLNSLMNEIIVSDGMSNPRNILRYNDILLAKNDNNYNVINGTHKLLMAKLLFEISYGIRLNCFDNNTIFYAKTLIKK